MLTHLNMRNTQLSIDQYWKCCAVCSTSIEANGCGIMWRFLKSDDPILYMEQSSATVRKSSKLMVIVPFCWVSRLRNASVNRWIWTQRTMNWSTETSLCSLTSLFKTRNLMKFGENRKPIWDRAEWIKERYSTGTKGKGIIYNNLESALVLQYGQRSLCQMTWIHSAIDWCKRRVYRIHGYPPIRYDLDQTFLFPNDKILFIFYELCLTTSSPTNHQFACLVWELLTATVNQRCLQLLERYFTGPILVHHLKQTLSFRRNSWYLLRRRLSISSRWSARMTHARRWCISTAIPLLATCIPTRFLARVSSSVSLNGIIYVYKSLRGNTSDVLLTGYAIWVDRN